MTKCGTLPRKTRNTSPIRRSPHIDQSPDAVCSAQGASLCRLQETSAPQAATGLIYPAIRCDPGDHFIWLCSRRFSFFWGAVVVRATARHGVALPSVEQPQPIGTHAVVPCTWCALPACNRTTQLLSSLAVSLSLSSVVRIVSELERNRNWYNVIKARMVYSCTGICFAWVAVSSPHSGVGSFVSGHQ